MNELIAAVTILPFGHALVRNMADGGVSVSNLLTGGGFVFLAAVMGGLFLMNKNAADGAKAIAEGSREYVEGAREELAAGRKELIEGRETIRQCNLELELERKRSAADRRDMRNAHDALEDAQKAIRAGQNERAVLREWINQQCTANAEHKEWDDELRTMLETHGLTIRSAPELAIDPPWRSGFSTS